ncbi:MAG: hypothetical protein LBK54_07190 [Propionibacteriaceae bacterium]|jgi:hypothetical protein|nr:hypothetical protein [Propionibacteriaceae bacterium]
MGKITDGGTMTESGVRRGGRGRGGGGHEALVRSALDRKLRGEPLNRAERRLLARAKSSLTAGAESDVIQSITKAAMTGRWETKPIGVGGIPSPWGLRQSTVEGPIPPLG